MFRKVKPGKHLQIQRVLRKIFTNALLGEGIVIPVRAESVEFPISEKTTHSY